MINLKHTSTANLLDPFGEEGDELLGLMVLHLPVLHRGSSQRIIQLHSLVCCYTCLILASLRSKPKVNVPLIAILVTLGLKKIATSYTCSEV